MIGLSFLFVFSGCGDKGKQLKPWSSSVNERIGFGFQDIDNNKGVIQGELILKLDPSLTPALAKNYVIYWSSTSGKSGQGKALATVSTKLQGDLLYNVPADTAIPEASGKYFLLFLRDATGNEIYSGKSTSVTDKFEVVDQKQPDTPVSNETLAPSKAPVTPMSPDTSTASNTETAPVVPEPVTTEVVPVTPVQPDKVEKSYIITVENVLFEFDRSSLKEGFKSQLNDTLGGIGNKNQIKFVLAGHADERGSNEYNLALGERRAYAVKRFLISLGYSTKNIRTISYGEEKPLDNGHNEIAWEKNRRSETKMLK